VKFTRLVVDERAGPLFRPRKTRTNAKQSLVVHSQHGPTQALPDHMTHNTLDTEDKNGT